MKLSRKQRFSKPSTVKRNPASVNHFHRKGNHLTLPLLESRQNQRKQFAFNLNNRQKKIFDSQFSPSESKKEGQSDTTIQKHWWIHLWSGLVLDKTGKHKQAIRQAIWLYLYFLLVANRESGRLYRRLSTIAAETGFNPRSIQRWLQTLREKGYIETHSTGRYLEILITKWRPISKRNKAKSQSSREQANPNSTNNFQSHNERFKRVY